MPRYAEDWLSDIRASGVTEIARRVGLQQLRLRSLTPCPACQMPQRSKHDKRGPIGLRRDDLGWECHSCKTKGDAITLAALALCGTTKPDKHQWIAIKEHILGASPLPIRVFKNPPPKPKDPVRPPTEEVLSLWETCIPVDEDKELSAQLVNRCIDPTDVSERDLARALPTLAQVPRWAWGPGGAWNQSGHRLLTPMFDETGQIQSLHARNIAENGPRPKGLSPARYDISGLVFAENFAQQILERGSFPEWWDFPQEKSVFIVTEGVTDFLTWATHYKDNAEDAPIVFGVIAGSWTPAIASRVPERCEVMVRTDQDAAGHKYADNICKTLLHPTRKIFRRVKETP
jgi:hypothetical protein